MLNTQAGNTFTGLRTLTLSQKAQNWMAKPKAPNARRVIIPVETLHATSHTYVEETR